MPSLRVTIIVSDDTTLEEDHGLTTVILTPSHQALIAKTSDAKNPAEWVAAELASILMCLEYIDGPDRIEES